MAVVVLDTDAASRLQKASSTGPSPSRWSVAPVVLTFVSVAELLKWAESRSWSAARKAELDRWLEPIPVVPVDRRVCSEWAKPSAAAERRGRPRPVNDMWVAACCLAADVPLVTYNHDDFEDFRQYHGLRMLPGGDES